MATKDWTTSYTGANPTQDPDPINQAGLMEDLDDLIDVTRSSQAEKPRDKLQAVCKMAGDSVNAPVGSLAEILNRDHANGDARQVRLRQIGSDPTPVASKGFVYVKGGELFYIDPSGNVSQISPAAKANFSATAIPAVGNDNTEGYSPGSIWVDVNNDKAYICVDASTGAAIWIEITQSGGAGGGFDREQEFTATSPDGSGRQTFTLSSSAAVNANTPSGYSVRVYVNGLKHQYQATPGTREFDMAAANQVRVGGLNLNDEVEIVYGV